MQGNGYERELKYKLARLPQQNKMSEQTKQRMLQTLKIEEGKLKKESNWSSIRAKMKWTALTLAAGLILVIGGLSLKDKIISPESGVTHGNHKTDTLLAKLSVKNIQSITATDGTSGKKENIDDAFRIKGIVKTLTGAHPKRMNAKDLKGYLYHFNIQTKNGMFDVTFLGDKMKVDNQYYALDYDVSDKIKAIVLSTPKIETTDNQNTKTNTPTTNHLAMDKVVRIQMLDNQMGWLQSDQEIAFTNDGGQHWNRVTPQDGLSSNLIPKMSIYGSHAWIALYNGDQVTIYRSTDSGSHWTNTTFKTAQQMQGVISTQFTDDRHGYVLLSGDAATGNEMVAIYQTSDGGATWSLVNATDPTHPGGAPYSGMKNGLYFKNDQMGWLTGLDHSDQPYLYQTIDGGKSWQQQLINVPDGFTAEGGSSMTYSPIFFDDNDGMMPVRFGGELHPYVFYSTHNGGATWEASSGSIHTANGESDMRDWEFINSKDGFVASGKQLFVTKDGGNHWTTITLNQGLEKIDFITSETGYGMSNGQLLKTTDGGNSWSVVTTFK